MRMKPKGFSLVEVMASVLLFMIGISAILSVCIDSKKSAQRAEYAYNAYNIAKNHIETLRAMAFSDLASAAESGSDVDQDGVADLDGAYNRTTAVTTSYAGDANLTQLTVTVYYTFRGQQIAQPMQMTTVVFSNG